MTRPSSSTVDRFQAGPFVLMGAPRSGTTFVVHLLNAHPEVFVTDETRIFAWLHQAVCVLPQQEQFLMNERRNVVAALEHGLAASIEQYYRRRAPGSLYWGDKNPHYADPRNAGCLETIERLFPGARFVHVLRDGREVVASILRMRDARGVPWASFEDAHLLWIEHVQIAREFGRSRADSYVEVRYEALIGEEGAQAAKRLFTALGIPWSDRVLEFIERERASPTPYSQPDKGPPCWGWGWGLVLDDRPPSGRPEAKHRASRRDTARVRLCGRRDRGRRLVGDVHPHGRDLRPALRLQGLRSRGQLRAGRDRRAHARRPHASRRGLRYRDPHFLALSALRGAGPGSRSRGCLPSPGVGILG